MTAMHACVAASPIVIDDASADTALHGACVFLLELAKRRRTRLAQQQAPPVDDDQAERAQHGADGTAGER